MRSLKMSESDSFGQLSVVGNEEWEGVMRLTPCGRLFSLFFKFLDLFLYIFGSESAALGPRADGRVEMCRRVLKTLRKMVNIKVFYKKVYNHLNIYTNTQIYIFIYTYILL